MYAIRSYYASALLTPFLSVARYAAANLPDERPASALASLQELPGCHSDDLARWQGVADLLLTAGGDLRRRLDKNCGFPPGNGREGAMKESMLALLGEPSLAPVVPWLREIRRLPVAAYPDHQWRILQALVDLLLLAARELWLVFRQESYNFV